ncbi:hypothetical protein A0H81_10689 [Grifola frondosa]|uniref:Uncharacterized protein n=1 Tax=Grifola frondosa TaxID=5627 RepID=A0A1C7M2Z4_GRIFR|nr:hypothetical protein A0H81_10689 [Grifola frondosa]
MTVIEEGMALEDLKIELLTDIAGDDGTDSMRGDISAKRKQFVEKLDLWKEQYDRHVGPLLEEAAAAVVVAVQDAVHASFPLAAPDVDDPADDDTGQATTTAGKRRHPPTPPPRPPLWHEIDAVRIDLPSSYDPRVQRHASMVSVVEVEKTLRQVQAKAALDEVRTHIITNEAFKIQKHNVSGQKATTRATNQIRKKQQAINEAASKYRRARRTLITLGMKREDRTYRELKPEDVRKFTLYSAQQQLGQSKETPSWIWESFSFVEEQQDEKYRDFFDDGTGLWLLPSDRLFDMFLSVGVHWFRSSALKQRWDEQVRLLEEEMRRTVRFFSHFKRHWSKKADAADQLGLPGEAAYARK